MVNQKFLSANESLASSSLPVSSTQTTVLTTVNRGHFFKPVDRGSMCPIMDEVVQKSMNLVSEFQKAVLHAG